MTKKTATHSIQINAQNNTTAAFNAANQNIQAHNNRLNQLGQTQRKQAASAKAGVAGFLDSTQGRMAASSAAFAIEDFLTVFTMTGWVGGMRAASNNVSMLARSLSGPLYGGIVGITAALLPTLINQLWGGSSAAARFSDEVDNLGRSLSRYKKEIQFDKDQFQLEKKFKEVMGPNGTQSGKRGFLNNIVSELENEVFAAKEGKGIINAALNDMLREEVGDRLTIGVPTGRMTTSTFVGERGSQQITTPEMQNVELDAGILTQGSRALAIAEGIKRIEQRGLQLTDETTAKVAKRIGEEYDRVRKKEPFKEQFDKVEDIDQNQALRLERARLLEEKATQVAATLTKPNITSPVAAKALISRSVEAASMLNEMIAKGKFATAGLKADEEAAQILSDIRELIEQMVQNIESGANQ